MRTHEVTTHFLVLKDGTVFGLDSSQARSAQSAMTTSTERAIYIGERLVPMDSISFLDTVEGYDEAAKRKRGEWMCKMGHWHKQADLFCKEIVAQEADFTELLDTKERVRTEEIIADQKRPKAERQFAQDKQREGWVRVTITE